MRYTFGDCELDTDLYTLYRAGEPVHLRPKVFQVLLYLLDARDRVVSKEELYAQIWPNQFMGDATLERTISTVRQAVGDNGRAQHIIRTLHGHGYRFVAAVTVLAEPSAPDPGQDTTDPLSLSNVSEDPLLPPATQSCPTCQHRYQGSAVFCVACGTQLRQPCMHCGQEVVLPAMFCIACGQPLRQPTEAPVSAVVRSHPIASSPAMLASGEHKVVTSLCCGLRHGPGIQQQVDIETRHNQMRAIYAVMHRVMQQYGGVLQAVVHECILAVFGAPIAQEEHAWQAVLAALAIQQQVAVVPLAHQGSDGILPVCLGLHTGPVVVGGLGQTPEAVTMVGDPVAIATALQAYAEPGTIVCSAMTARLVRDGVRLRAIGSVAVEGQSLVVPAYRILRSIPTHTPRSRRVIQGGHVFVGRHQELATLQALWTQVEAGHGHVVGLVGELGIGKSRLCHEFRQRLQERQYIRLSGSCFSYGQATPYLPVLDLLRQHWGISDTDTAAVLRHKVQHGLEAVGMVPEEWTPYLLHLFAIAPESADIAPLSASTLKARLLEALLYVCLHTSQQMPVLLEIEDLHWIDASSEDCLTALVERLARVPILLLTTYRPGYTPPWLGYSYVTQLALSRLAASESQRMVQERLPRTRGQASLAQEILRKADGNPFFLEELVRTVTERGEDATLQSVPDTIQAVLAARLDRLPVAEKHLLQAAAIIGHTVPVPVLQALGIVPEERLFQYLRRLQQMEFLHEKTFLPVHTYMFSHVLTQEVAYQSLLAQTRQQLHTQIAQVLSEHFPETVAIQPEWLAHHYTEAGNSLAAVRYWQQAGHRAIRRAAHVEARAHLQQGLALLQTLPDTPERTEQELTLHLLLSTTSVKRNRTIGF